MTEQERTARPDLALAVAHHRAGRLADAKRIYRLALCLEPAQTDALHLLGQAAGQEGDAAQAVRWIGRAAVAGPSIAPLLDSLAVACHRLALLRRGADVRAAAALFRHVLILRPDRAEAYHNAALTQDGGRPDERAATYRRAVRLQPDRLESWVNLAPALTSAGQLEAAAAVARRAASLAPAETAAHSGLGLAAMALGRPEEARTAHRRALLLDPEDDAHSYNLALALQEAGRLDEAVAAYRTALVQEPGNRTAHSNLLLVLNYLPDTTRETLFEEHRRFGLIHARPASGPFRGQLHANPRDRERRLRIGYVSADLREHPVATFLIPLLEAHDRSRFVVCCYAEGTETDAVTDRLRRLSDRWRPIHGLGADAVAAMIRADGVDVLVDLSGHTAGNRLDVFARCPAPVQMTWLGYPGTTGLTSIGYRLVDAVTDPVGEADRLASERLVRLPRGFLCYRPPAAAPPVAEPPDARGGPVTFGCFNNLNKVTPRVIALWAALLLRVPGARLRLKSRQLADPAVRDACRARFAAAGVAAGRLDLDPWSVAEAEHLAAYGAIDIALDPFPYNGTTTTCEALWMGVPVVTLRGDRHAARVGASLLTRIGLEELVASSPAAYLDAAAALAGDPARLAALRATLRDRMRRSSLCDAQGFARQVEDAYRQAWEDTHIS